MIFWHIWLKWYVSIVRTIAFISKLFSTISIFKLSQEKKKKNQSWLFFTMVIHWSVFKTRISSVHSQHSVFTLLFGSLLSSQGVFRRSSHSPWTNLLPSRLFETREGNASGYLHFSLGCARMNVVHFSACAMTVVTTVTVGWSTWDSTSRVPHPRLNTCICICRVVLQLSRDVLWIEYLDFSNYSRVKRLWSRALCQRMSYLWSTFRGTVQVRGQRLYTWVQ